MTNTLAIEGFVGSDPRVSKTNQGTTVCSFRTAVNHRRLDSTTGQWVNNGTSWYTVTTYGTLADNVAAQVHKGSAVVVVGDLKIREWEANGRQGTSVEITASAVGPNLLFAGSAKSEQAQPQQSPVVRDAAFIEAPTDLSQVEGSPAQYRDIADEEIPF